jgi:8-oxo-dGTP pyrophosphatase MutT (NUDIX family)
VRFDDVVRRLEPLPFELPEAPAELLPVILDAGGPRPRPSWPAPDGTSRPAAVLVQFSPDDAGEARIVLTERTDRGGHHSGEVSFPGGRAEPGDEDLVATALREAAEEIGLDPAEAGVRVLGTLPVQWIPVSNFTVTPVVAVAARRPAMVAQASEVAAILEPVVRVFLPGGPLVWVERELRGWPLRYAAFPVEGLNVWGMTARVLGGLGAHLAGAAPAATRPDDPDAWPPPVPAPWIDARPAGDPA